VDKEQGTRRNKGQVSRPRPPRSRDPPSVTLATREPAPAKPRPPWQGDRPPLQPPAAASKKPAEQQQAAPATTAAGTVVQQMEVETPTTASKKPAEQQQAAPATTAAGGDNEFIPGDYDSMSVCMDTTDEQEELNLYTPYVNRLEKTIGG
jgi:hypothetical protein